MSRQNGPPRGKRSRKAAGPPAAFFVPTVESAAAVLNRAIEIRESVGVAISEQPSDGPTGRIVAVDIIRSGWNSSGSRYYPAEVLERDIPKVYGKGTQLYIDHPRASEQDDIPERSLTTLAGVFEDEPWAVREADGTLVMRTNVRVFGPWQPLIREAWQSIGLSINGGGTGEYGERDGREGMIIEALTHGRSVDFVTVPGAGGRVVALMESHRPFESPEFRQALSQIVATREAGSLGAYVESRIHLGFTELGDQLYGEGRVTREERITLSGAIGDALAAFVSRVEADAPQLYQRGRYAEPQTVDGDVVTEEAAQLRLREATAEQSRTALNQALDTAYGGPERAVWVEDYDPDRGLVWFYASDGEHRGCMWQQAYITSNGTAVLTGDRLEVRRRTVYEPVPAGEPVATTERGVRLVADMTPYVRAAATAAAITETTAGGVPAADDGPHDGAPAITTEESEMGEKTADVVAREAAEARATAAELRLARFEAGETAAPIVGQLLAEADLPQPAKDKIRAEYAPAALPLREADRSLDESALRARVAASITAERTYVASLLEAAGVGKVTGQGAAAGAGTGMPAGYVAPAATSSAPGGSFFGFGMPAGPVLTEQQTRESAAATTALVEIFTRRGMSQQAAEQAVANL